MSEPVAPRHYVACIHDPRRRTYGTYCDRSIDVGTEFYFRDVEHALVYDARGKPWPVRGLTACAKCCDRVRESREHHGD